MLWQTALTPRAQCPAGETGQEKDDVPVTGPSRAEGAQGTPWQRAVCGGPGMRTPLGLGHGKHRPDSQVTVVSGAGNGGRDSRDVKQSSCPGLWEACDDKWCRENRRLSPVGHPHPVCL